MTVVGFISGNFGFSAAVLSTCSTTDVYPIINFTHCSSAYGMFEEIDHEKFDKNVTIVKVIMNRNIIIFFILR